MRALLVGQTAFETLLKRQIAKICVTVLAIVCVAGWAHEFVWAGISSNAYLNGVIIGVFIFGVGLVLKGVLQLRNEELAFEALQEAFEDARIERSGLEDDPFRRHLRALQPGKVFGRPVVLGHMFALTYDELLRTRNLRIPLGTMQGIIDGIESKLGEQRSLPVYITGLLVFLGLIGTFIGLMEMVGSVGGIIGGLQSLQQASGQAMQQLLKSLEQPLRGMATGFSSSLFGLFGSLALGIISRMGAAASNAMKQEFEAWLASVAQIENSKGQDVGDLARMISNNLMGAPASGQAQQGQAPAAAAAPAAGYGGFSPLSDVGVVATLSQGFGRSQEGLGALNVAMGRMVESQEQGTELMRQAALHLERMAADAQQTREQVVLLASQQGTQAEYLQELVALNRTLESRLTSGFNGMAHVMEVTGQAYLDGLRRLTAENYETNARLAKLLDIKAASDRITEIATGIESKVKGSFNTMSSQLERSALAMEKTVEKLAEGQREIKEALKGGVGGSVGMSAEFEHKLASSFSEMSRSFETVFAAYSTIVSRALANQPAETGQGHHAPARPDRALEAAWTPRPDPASGEEAQPDAEDDRRRQFYELAARQLRGAQAG